MSLLPEFIDLLNEAHQATEAVFHFDLKDDNRLTFAHLELAEENALAKLIEYTATYHRLLLKEVHDGTKPVAKGQPTGVCYCGEAIAGHSVYPASDHTPKESYYPDPTYFIVCTNHVYEDKLTLWRPRAQGYTVLVKDAGIYSEAEARAHHSPQHGSFMVPTQVILDDARSVVNRFDYLPELQRLYSVPLDEYPNPNIPERSTEAATD